MEIIFIGFSIIGGALVSLVYRPDAVLTLKLARVYILLVVLLSIGAWGFYFAGIKNQFISNLLDGIVSWGKYPARNPPRRLSVGHHFPGDALAPAMRRIL